MHSLFHCFHIVLAALDQIADPLPRRLTSRHVHNRFRYHALNIVLTNDSQLCAWPPLRIDIRLNYVAADECVTPHCARFLGAFRMRDAFEVHCDEARLGEVFLHFSLLNKVSIGDADRGFDHEIEYTDAFHWVFLEDLKIREYLVPGATHFLVGDHLVDNISSDPLYQCICLKQHNGTILSHLLIHTDIHA